MVRARTVSLAVALALTLGCTAGQPPPPPAAPTGDTRAQMLADAYLDGFFSRNPDQVTLFGVPGRRHDKLPDNSLEALRLWQAREDGWLKEAQAVDPATIQGSALKATQAILREALEGSVAARVCRNELWSVSQFVNGWQVQDGYLVTIQPVGTDEARKDALARWSALPAFVDKEIANLREGLKAGYSAPKGNVRLVIDQMNTLIGTPLAESPFDSPSVRDKTDAFRKPFDLLVREQIVPAFTRYRDFLAREYLPAAREAVGVSA